ncbi:endoglucanase [Fibrobacteria bacterium R8-3-H12]
MYKAIFATVLCCFMLFSVANGAVNYPYPQAKNYDNSTINVTTANASTNLKSKFTSFLNNFYVEGNCSGTNDCARIKFDNTAQTVSEGIAYGMIMMVYFSDNSTNYQTQFDKLWKYYQKWVNERGLMRWKIDGFSAKIEDNAASDADFDVGVALVMAHYQFGSTASKNYLDTAKALIKKIRQQEISDNNLHKPGDVWDDKRNPSYISPAAWEIFREVEGSPSAKTKWQDVITANYTLLSSNNSKSSNGLFTDWCDDTGAGVQGPDNKPIGYNYDAARVPWRLAWANAWYGHSSAKTLLGKVVTYLGSKSATNTGFDGNSTFIGPFMNAFSVASSNQSKMNDFWATLIDKSGEPYYSAALQVLTGLLATGNMPNLKKLKGDNCCTEETVAGLQIDKLASAANESVADRNYARTWEPWYVFTDAGDKGASTIKNNTFKNVIFDKETQQCKEITDYDVIMQDGTGTNASYVVKIDHYELIKGNNQYQPYVAIGLDALNNGTAYQLSNCTGGFKYDYKGAAHNFKAQLKTVKDFGYHQMKQSASDNWLTITVPPDELVQESWADAVKFELKNIEAFSWEVKGGLSTATGSLSVKNFYCIGSNLTFPAEKPESKCGSGGSSSSVKSSSSGTSGQAGSSSSVRSSSSGTSGQAGSSSSVRSSSSGTSGQAGSSSSVRSSSSGTGGQALSSSSAANNSNSSSSSEETSFPSSSSGDNTPIVLHSPVRGNALNSMNNGVNLQTIDNAAIQIFDLKGNAIRTLKFEPGNYVVQFSDLPRGLYVVKATSQSWKQTIKIYLQ